MCVSLDHSKSRAIQEPTMADLTHLRRHHEPESVLARFRAADRQGVQRQRAFEAGWGGVVWKTLGEDPPIVNVNGPRYGALYAGDRRLIGFNNIELITDRPLQINLEEIARVKRNWPDRAVVVSLMVPCEEASWSASAHGRTPAVTAWNSTFRPTA
jgi:dihydroorotate dehydrogenase